MGRGSGDEDSVSLIDLTRKPLHTVTTVGVHSGPEPLKFSPDATFLAIGAASGTPTPADHPFHAEQGLLGLYTVSGHGLHNIARRRRAGGSRLSRFRARVGR